MGFNAESFLQYRLQPQSLTAGMKSRIFLAAAAIAVLAATSWRWLSRRRLRKLASMIPGPPTLPIIGNLSVIMGTNDQAFRNLWNFSKQYFLTCRLWFPSCLVVFVADGEDLKTLLNSISCLSREFVRKPVSLANLHHDIYLAKPEDLVRQRKVIYPAFKIGILKKYVPIMFRKSEELMENIEQTNHEEFDIHKLIKICITDSIFSPLMGVNANLFAKRQKSFQEALHYLGQFIVEGFRKPWLCLVLIFMSSRTFRNVSEKRRIMVDTIDSITKEHEEKMLFFYQIGNFKEENATESLNGQLLTKLMDHTYGNQTPTLNTDEMEMDISTIYYAAFDTTPVAIAFVLSLLGFHTQVQEHLQGMKYLKQVIQETLRLYPPVPFAPREVSNDVDIKGYTIPAGTVVTFNYMA
ncbi:hypothetical protein PR048_027078 [Dryococelus australis]|uniref:Cytochrome P450 n=1 Tax=Dryococelus australis TaxID=614101 RepID=A0ABQ9GGH4_9NEOP|nr:hypothetical protein PR048_027078 [Dryococelus australis]